MMMVAERCSVLKKRSLIGTSQTLIPIIQKQMEQDDKGEEGVKQRKMAEEDGTDEATRENQRGSEAEKGGKIRKKGGGC